MQIEERDRLKHASDAMMTPKELDHDFQIPSEFFLDWLSVAADESRHLGWLLDRLGSMGSHYGAIPAHNNLWETAVKSSSDLIGRLACVPMVQEARALDSHTRLCNRLTSSGDAESANIIDQICQEELSHVASGVRWFEWMLSRRLPQMPPSLVYQTAVLHFSGLLVPPFNESARLSAGMPPTFYVPISFRRSSPVPPPAPPDPS